MVTSWPAARSRLTSSLPINSVPPITRTRIFVSPRPASPRSDVQRAGRLPLSVVIFETEVRNEILAFHPAKRVLEDHQLNENVVLGIKARSRHRRFEIEREPLLNAAQVGALRQI